MKEKLFLMLIILAFLSSCAQSTKEKNIIINESSSAAKDEILCTRYNDYLLLMTEIQRANFFQLKNDLAREHFLKEKGLDYYKELNDKLKLDMDKAQVVKLIGTPQTKEINVSIVDKETKWIYSFFNGYGNKKYALTFHNDKLVDWTLLSE